MQMSVADELANIELTLDAKYWHGSFNHRESSLQQLAPYIGKLKSGMVRVLIRLYSLPGEVIFDPFSGSGVVPLESALLGRIAWANDLNPYAFVLTRGKLSAPARLSTVVRRAEALLAQVDNHASGVDTSNVPVWIRDFFDIDTLREILYAIELLHTGRDYFLMSCLMGILHHQRPGFLSYPASHLVPYLREAKFPKANYPELYKYRELRSRLLAKVERMYRNPILPGKWSQRKFRVWRQNSMNLSAPSNGVDAIISSPPYFGALDYARDNRLRLWFLGTEDWRALDESLTANKAVYLDQMAVCLREFHRVLKTGKYCVLVLGDVEENGRTRRTAETIAQLAVDETNGGFFIETIYDDRIPDNRRSRRGTQTTKFERILVMRKNA